MDDDFFKKFDQKFDNFDIRSDFNSFDKHQADDFGIAQRIFFVFFGLVTLFIVGVFAFVIFSICFRLCRGESYHDYRRTRQCQTIIPPPPPLTGSSPVVVTTTTIPVPPGSGYPPPNAAIQGYPMPQPGYVPQPYPNQTIPPYPMPQTQSQPLPQADYNPPSYDQVMRGGEAYQKQAPYNPNYSGQ